MIYLWNIARRILAVISFICVYGAASESDYCMTMGQPDTPIITTLIIVAIITALPTIGHLIYKSWGKFINED